MLATLELKDSKFKMLHFGFTTENDSSQGEIRVSHSPVDLITCNSLYNNLHCTDLKAVKLLTILLYLTKWYVYLYTEVLDGVKPDVVGRPPFLKYLKCLNK